MVAGRRLKGCAGKVAKVIGADGRLKVEGGTMLALGLDLRE